MPTEVQRSRRRELHRTHGNVGCDHGPGGETGERETIDVHGEADLHHLRNLPVVVESDDLLATDEAEHANRSGHDGWEELHAQRDDALEGKGEIEVAVLTNAPRKLRGIAAVVHTDDL